MNGSTLKGLPVVQLQLLDELTGEPLEFVNPMTVAGKVFSETARAMFGDKFSISMNEDTLPDIDSVVAASIDKLAYNIGQTMLMNNAFIAHTTNQSNLTYPNEMGEDTQPGGEGVHAVKELLDKCLNGFDYDSETGIVTFTRYDGSQFQWDSAIEHVPINFGWCENDPDHPNCFYLTSDGGTTQYIDFTRLIDIYKGIDNPQSPVITDVVNNVIRADIRVNSLGLKYLSEEVTAYLNRSKAFIDKYEDKIENIEENANKYILPTAKTEDYVDESGDPNPDNIDKRLGGVIAGHNISVSNEGVISATNIMYGESVETAVPVNLFMKIVKTGAPSTTPVPTLTAGKSYIASDGSFYIWLENTPGYDFIQGLDGTRIRNLSVADANMKLYAGIELIELSTITWYHDDEHNYAITQYGDGFRYGRSSHAIDFNHPYLTTDDFVEIINSGNYDRNQSDDFPPLMEVR